MFDPKAFIEEQVAAIQTAVGAGRAILACSGGVDSTTAAVLASRALGNRLLAVYVDTGLMRKGETEQVSKALRDVGVTFRVLHAADAFFGALKGVADPEAKRSVIGSTFIELFEREAGGFRAEFLVQGTIAPDWIESGGQLRDRIKTHHNVAGLPATMKLKLVEPLRDLYKDEVRQVARALGVPVSERQPFPGPALAVRCVGEVTREGIETVRSACAIVEQEIEAAAKAGRMALPWQYFAVLLPTRSVGVHGDVRVYGRVIAVRAVESVDGMTAKYVRVPHDVLDRISVRITNEVRGVNRVVYDVSNKPPATIEWE
jgi:GMP synthase (glutamine-hydrolysing)